MAAPIRPAGAKLFGRDKWIFVPAIADTAAPTVAEVGAASGIDLSCYFYTSTGKPDVNQNRVTPPARICDTQQYEAMGLGQWQGGDVHYAVDPQAAAGSDGKKAYEALPEGTTGFLVNRAGVDVDTDVAAGQFVVSYPVQFGTPVVTAEGDGEAAEVAIKQAFAITGPPSEIVAVAA
jgi:hypothetical protein